MGQIAFKDGNTVFQFVAGITEETLETDNQYRSGTITGKVGPKVRIRWNGTMRYEYVTLDDCRRMDKDTIVWEKPWDGMETGHTVKSA